MITLDQRGNFNKTFKYLNKIKNINIQSILKKYGELGVQQLSAATPSLTGKTASSWKYVITKNGPKNYTLSWNNTNLSNGIPIVILIEYGHGTKNGGYVAPRSFINNTLKPIITKISQEIETEVKSI